MLGAILPPNETVGELTDDRYIRFYIPFAYWALKSTYFVMTVNKQCLIYRNSMVYIKKFNLNKKHYSFLSLNNANLANQRIPIIAEGRSNTLSHLLTMGKSTDFNVHYLRNNGDYEFKFNIISLYVYRLAILIYYYITRMNTMNSVPPETNGETGCLCTYMMPPFWRYVQTIASFHI